MTDDITRYDAVEAYCDRLSVAPGTTLRLHVACRTDYSIEIHRWGATREPVWSADGLAGEDHPVPADADANGCGWPVAVSVPIGEEWRSGFYLVTLTAHGAPSDRAVGYASFVVRRAARQARALLVVATNTYNAYNSWGGKSLYTGGVRVSFARPFGRGMLMRPETERDDRKARPVYRRGVSRPDGKNYQGEPVPPRPPRFPGFAGGV